MSLDDRVLTVQHALDRAIRRLRRGAPPLVTHKRLLVVQIDGLSRAVLEHALASGRTPFIKRLLRHQGYRMQPMSVGLPTSTPAFQMATMFGVRPDIPGFHFYNRARRGDVHFPRSGHAAWVEERQAAGRHGILAGGSAYGCCFTGGAANNFFTFASLTKPSGRGLLSALSPYLVVSWVAGKNIALTFYELGKALPRYLAHPHRARRGWRWLGLKIGMGIWVHNFFTMAVSRDLYEGVPAIYVNYIDYDEASHAFGPRSARAMQALHGVDRAIARLWRVMRRVPEHRYDAYILADHGQTPCRPYGEVTKGRRLERWVFDTFLRPADAVSPDRLQRGLGRGLRARRHGTPALFQHFMNYLHEDYFRRSDPEAYEQDGVRVISAGPNGFLYVTDSPAPLDAASLDRRFPQLAERLSLSPAIGFVLARSDDGGGPVCFWKGKRCELGAGERGPFEGREDVDLVIEGLRDLMKMPSAGDYVIYGNGSPQGDVSFLSEHGAHAGPSASEMQTFIVRPGSVTLPERITHPVQLYAHFITYQEPYRAEAEMRRSPPV